MKTIYLWQDAPFMDRINVYDNYVYRANMHNDFDHLTFEEFDAFWHNKSFYYVASAYD